jgi:peptidoglycan/LPS O-acetylase OafA/YrhL
MIRTVDRAFGVLLLIGAILHAYGSIRTYAAGTPTLVWALSGSLAAGLLAILNLLRAGRPGDNALAWITFIGCLCWVCLALAFGSSIGRVVDPRVLWHVICAVMLALFSLRMIVGARIQQRT